MSLAGNGSKRILDRSVVSGTARLLPSIFRTQFDQIELLLVRSRRTRRVHNGYQRTRRVLTDLGRGIFISGCSSSHASTTTAAAAAQEPEFSIFPVAAWFALSLDLLSSLARSAPSTAASAAARHSLNTPTRYNRTVRDGMGQRRVLLLSRICLICRTIHYTDTQPCNLQLGGTKH